MLDMILASSSCSLPPAAEVKKLARAKGHAPSSIFIIN
jgi:hypothetical protein